MIIVPFTVDYTFEGKSNLAKSCIDHFIVTDHIFQRIEYCSVSHDGDNMSDHDVVSIKVSINITHDMADEQHFNKVLWQRATNDQLEEYKYALDDL